MCVAHMVGNGEMRFGALEYFVAAMLLVLGFVFGSLSPKTTFWEFDIVNAFEMAASIGTVLAAVIAIPALNSWRKQFKHGEKVKRLEGLRSIDGAFAALYSLCDSHNQHVACKLRNDDDANLHEEISKSRSLYFERVTEFSNSWRDAKIVMDPIEIKNFRWNPDRLVGFGLEIVTALATIQYHSPSGVNESLRSPFLILMDEYNLSRASLRDAVVEAREDIDDLIRANI